MAEEIKIKGKVKKDLEGWLRLGQKVYHYRRDQLSPDAISSIQAACVEVESILSEKTATEERINVARQKLEGQLRLHGGKFYPKPAWAENFEMFLVAAILAIGIRTFFIQPFKIPTNSMYPTYNGMTYEIYEPAETPNVAAKGLHKLAFGSSFYEVAAPDEGELLLPFQLNVPNVTHGLFHGIAAKGRKFFILPSPVKDIPIVVGNEMTTLRVPLEFNSDQLLMEVFFPENSNLFTQEELAAWKQRMVSTRGKVTEINGQYFLRTGKTFKKGETVLSFEILTGDALFVDRASYHFVRPDIGDPFVFRTRNIDTITEQNGGVPDDKYYIKRLVGRGGDTLEVREPVLFRNGEPITGAEVFAKNAGQEGEHDGYFAWRLLRPGQSYTLPEGTYFAMGDNSDQSLDSRWFGGVPEQEVIGRAIFIYYPFTKRWGPAK